MFRLSCVGFLNVSQLDTLSIIAFLLLSTKHPQFHNFHQIVIKMMLQFDWSTENSFVMSHHFKPNKSAQTLTLKKLNKTVISNNQSWSNFDRKLYCLYSRV